MREPAQRGTVGLRRGAARTKAVISRTRTSSSTRPAKTKQSPGDRRAMKPSSTEPRRAPRSTCTVMLASLTMVPMLARWRRARRASGRRQTPSSPGTTRR
jgi:hypothetical protein